LVPPVSFHRLGTGVVELLVGIESKAGHARTSYRISIAIRLRIDGKRNRVH